MPSDAGFTARPYTAGRGALVCMYGFGVPAAFMLMFLSVAAVPMGGYGTVLVSQPLRVVAIAMGVCALAALGSLVAAIIQAYSADAATGTVDDAEVTARRRESWAASVAAAAAPTDPWAGHEVAPEADRLTADELAPAGR